MVVLLYKDRGVVYRNTVDGSVMVFEDEEVAQEFVLSKARLMSKFDVVRVSLVSR
jgi:hypothetical protein